MLEDAPKTFQVDARRRLLLLGGGLGVLFSVLSGRLFYLQLVKGGTYRDMADDNRISLQPLAASRGRIFDRDNRLLVENTPDYQLSVIPELAGRQTVAGIGESSASFVKNGYGQLSRTSGKMAGLHRLFRQLKPFLQLDEKDIQAILKRARRQRAFLPLTIKTHLTWKELSQIEARIHTLPGVTIEIQPLRHYLLGSVSAHVIGYMGEVLQFDRRSFPNIHFRSGDLLGKSGVERSMEPALRGLEGFREVEVNAFGRQVRELRRTHARPGQDIYLTLDMDLQKEAEQALVESAGAAGAVVVMNPNSGELLVVASQPAYDPNKFVSGFSADEWKQLVDNVDHPLTNKAIQGQYPPGSTFKMVVVLAALATGKINKSFRVNCRGFITLHDHRFYCWKLRGHGSVNLVQAITQSCDTFFYALAEKVGIDAIQGQALRLGLGSVTGIDLGGERPGLIPSQAWKRNSFRAPWYPGETLITAIGQGYVLSTPLQLAVMMSAIANGGAVYRPFLVKPKVDEAGRDGPKPRWHNRFDFEQLSLLREGLEGVVHSPMGTARASQLEGVRMAGKTGTSQVVRHRRTQSGSLLRSENYRHKDHALFVAYAPVHKPEIAVSVVLEHGGGGGSNAAPVAKRVMDLYFAKKRGEPISPSMEKKDGVTSL